MFDLTHDKQDSRGRNLKRFWLILISVAICLGVSGYGYAAAEEKSTDQLIAEALLPLPEPLPVQERRWSSTASRGRGKS